MEKKYRLLENDTITVGGRTLYRIEALRDFADVKKGDKGGYIEKEITYRIMVTVGYLMMHKYMLMIWFVAMKKFIARQRYLARL